MPRKAVNKVVSAEYSRSLHTDDFSLMARVCRLNNDLERLWEMADFIERKMADIKERVAKADYSQNLEGRFYLGLNSIGELQALGPQLDILVAMAERSVDDFNEAKRKEKKQ